MTRMTFAECLAACRALLTPTDGIALEVIRWDGPGHGNEIRWGLWVSRLSRHIYAPSPEQLVENVRAAVACGPLWAMSVDEVVT